MHDTKERLSLLWIFALLNYLYADVFALFDIVGSQDPAPHFTAMGDAGICALDGDTHRDDSGISNASV
jgi:hypothetical protein